MSKNMSNTNRNFAKQSRNNIATITLDISAIPDKAFIPVIRRRNIVQAQVQQADGKRTSGIVIYSPMGDSTTMKAAEVLKKFRYLNDKKINMHGWMKGKQYTIYCNDESKFFAMQVPINMVVQVNGRKANSPKAMGDYIVCYGGADGKVDKRTAAIIQAFMFHKMFSIPNHEVIQRHRGKKNKVFNPQERVLRRLQNTSGAAVVNKPIQGAQGVQGVGNQNRNQSQIQTRPQIKPAQNIRQNIQQQRQGTQPTSPMNPRYGVNTATLPNADKTVARPLNTPKQNNVQTVGKLMRGQKIVGFVLRDTKTNRITNVDTDKMKALIAKGIVTDVMVQKNIYNVEFFRGNGIQIERLPGKQV